MRQVLRAGLLLLIALTTAVTPVSAAINSESEFKTNLGNRQADELFDLGIGDITQPFEWLKSRHTYSVLEINESGEEIYWFNVPNLQSVIYNEATSFLPTGYMGSGTIPHDRGGLRFVNIPKPQNANTAMQRFGFQIPSPAYLGETPRITMSVMGVIVESNPIKFAVNKIRGIFGGSIIEAPDTSDYHTLKYLTPSDYEASDNTFENWAELYWNDVMDEMKEGQVLVSGADENGMKNGVEMVKATIITDFGLNKIEPGGARQLNDKLKEILGPDYQDVVTHIIAFGIQEGVAKGFDQTPERIMPYDIETLTDTDAKNLVADPRTQEQTPISIFGLDLNLGIDNMVLNNIAGFFLSIAGVMSELTVFLNGITTFSTIESLGVDVVALWQSPIMTFLSAIIMISLVVILLGHIIKVVKGEGSISKVFTDTLISFLILGLIFSMSITPERTYGTVKEIASWIMNFGAESLAVNDTARELMGNGDASERADTAYWTPYFSFWTNYNTGHNLNDSSLKIDWGNKDNEPELVNMEPVKLSGNTTIDLWSAKLAESFTSGPAINRDAYRVVDHLMAPRLKVGEAPQIFKTTVNENFTRPIQSSIDIGLFLIISILFFGVMIKLVLFLEAMYYLIMAPVYLALSTYDKSRVRRAGKELLAAFVRVGLWDIVLSMIIFISMISSGVVCFILTIVMIIGFWKGIKALSYSNSVLVPTTLKMVRQYI